MYSYSDLGALSSSKSATRGARPDANWFFAHSSSYWGRWPSRRLNRAAYPRTFSFFNCRTTRNSACAVISFIRCPNLSLNAAANSYKVWGSCPLRMVLIHHSRAASCRKVREYPTFCSFGAATVLKYADTVKIQLSTSSLVLPLNTGGSLGFIVTWKTGPYGCGPPNRPAPKLADEGTGGIPAPPGN